MNETKLISIGKASQILGVHVGTLREWHENGKLMPVKTLGNHRRYRLSDVISLCVSEPIENSVEDVVLESFDVVTSVNFEEKTYTVAKISPVLKSGEVVRNGNKTTQHLKIMFEVIEEKEIKM